MILCVKKFINYRTDRRVTGRGDRYSGQGVLDAFQFQVVFCFYRKLPVDVDLCSRQVDERAEIDCAYMVAQNIFLILSRVSSSPAVAKKTLLKSVNRVGISPNSGLTPPQCA